MPETTLGVGELSRLLPGACYPFGISDAPVRQVFYPKPLFICNFMWATI